MMSTSEKFRQEGNAVFLTSKDLAIGSTIQKFRLEKASSLYTQALQASNTSDEESSAAKNLVVTNFSIAGIALHDGDLKKYEYHLTQGVKYATVSINSRTKPAEWKRGVRDRVDQAAGDLCGNIREYMQDDPVLVGTFTKLTLEIAGNAVFSGRPRVQMYTMLIDKHFHFAVKLREEFKYVEAKQRLHDCNRPMELLKQLCDRENSLQAESDYDVKVEEIKTEMAICEARNDIRTADQELTALLKNEEFYDQQAAWLVADKLRQAIVSVKDQATSTSYDVETEAIAYSRLGHLYDDIMKLPHSMAKTCYRQTVTLALSLAPRNISNEDWYKRAQAALKKYQEDVDRNDSTKEADRKKKIMESSPGLKNTLEKLRSIDDRISCIQEVYKAFKPRVRVNKRTGFTEEEVKDLSSMETLKSAYKVALTQYHPDQNKKFNEDVWTVTCEEICKILTKHYETLK